MVDQFYPHIQAIPYNEYKDITISLVKAFSEHALNKKIQN
jgi:hypothetical protein